MGKTNIEWAGHVWNPLAGCSVLTPGCTNCYAMKLAARLGRMNQPLYAGLTKHTKGGAVWTGEMRRASNDVLLAPLKRKKPTTYFVNSMSDLFHENVPDEWIDRIFAVMALSPQHIFQVLTKRAKRMRDYIARQSRPGPTGDEAPAMDIRIRMTAHHAPAGKWAQRIAWPLPNVWLGVSTERQEEADERIPLLLQTPAAVRFISAEPLLGPIDVHLWMLTSPALNWVIVGGESGHGYRPMNPDWARDLRDQCTSAGVPVFVKQMAGKKPIPPDLQVRQFPS
jgi:protein gp37